MKKEDNGVKSGEAMAIPAAPLPSGIGREVGGGGGRGMDCGIVGDQSMILVLAGMMKRRREGRLG